MQSFACDYSTLVYGVDERVAYLHLNRPDKGNALNTAMINQLLDVLHRVQIDKNIHLLVLTAAGKHFCTGADLEDMRDSINYSFAENEKQAIKLASLMQQLHELEVPILAMVNGAVYGGGLGLLANCDIVIAQKNARFCLSEVKLGLIPAVISPYLIKNLGMRPAKYLMLSAQTISADEALSLGLVHQVVAEDQLAHALNEWLEKLLANAPQALRAVKKLCHELPAIKDVAALQSFTANLIAKVRVGSEAQARLHAFFEDKHV